MRTSGPRTSATLQAAEIWAGWIGWVGSGIKLLTGRDGLDQVAMRKCFYKDTHNLSKSSSR